MIDLAGGYLEQYGVLGIWTISLLVERYHYNSSIKKLINANVIILNQLQEKLKK